MAPSSPPPSSSAPPGAPLRPSRHVRIVEQRVAKHAFSVGSVCAVRATQRSEDLLHLQVMGRDDQHVYVRWTADSYERARNLLATQDDIENEQPLHKARILVDAQGVEFAYVMTMRVKAQ